MANGALAGKHGRSELMYGRGLSGIATSASPHAARNLDAGHVRRVVRPMDEER